MHFRLLHIGKGAKCSDLGTFVSDVPFCWHKTDAKNNLYRYMQDYYQRSIVILGKNTLSAC